jgi:HEPN domain-containing protein/predicted nucleotidyltransferase
MLSSLESIVQRLVEQYDPDRVILFGSQATGHAVSESDFDLLVVKDTELRPIDRRVEVDGLLADRVVPLDLFVYTPAELRLLYSSGSPFIQEVFRTGKVVFMRKPTRTWMAQARDELETAGILLDNAKYQPVCYHSQQCVEKALKALVIEKAATVPRSHDIVELRTRALVLGWKIVLDTDDAVFLNSVYRSRYPTEEGLLPHGEPTKDDAQRAHDTAQSLLESAEALLASLTDSSGESSPPAKPDNGSDS